MTSFFHPSNYVCIIGEGAVITPVRIYSEKDLTASFTKVVQGLANQDDWQIRIDALSHIQGLAAGDGIEFIDVFLSLLKGCHDLILEQISDLRSVVCKEACRTVALLANRMGPYFAQLADFWMPKLIKLTAVKIQVMSIAADRCIRTIMVASPTGFPKVIPLLADASTSKTSAPALRRCAIEYACLACSIWKTESLDTRAHLPLLKQMIKSGISDADPAVRRAGRLLFWVMRDREGGPWQLTMEALFSDELDSSTQKHVMAEKASPTAAFTELMALYRNANPFALNKAMAQNVSLEPTAAVKAVVPRRGSQLDALASPSSSSTGSKVMRSGTGSKSSSSPRLISDDVPKSFIKNAGVTLVPFSYDTQSANSHIRAEEVDDSLSSRQHAVSLSSLRAGSDEARDGGGGALAECATTNSSNKSRSRRASLSGPVRIAKPTGSSMPVPTESSIDSAPSHISLPQTSRRSSFLGPPMVTSASALPHDIDDPAVHPTDTAAEKSTNSDSVNAVCTVTESAASHTRRLSMTGNSMGFGGSTVRGPVRIHAVVDSGTSVGAGAAGILSRLGSGPRRVAVPIPQSQGPVTTQVTTRIPAPSADFGQSTSTAHRKPAVSVSSSSSDLSTPIDSFSVSSESEASRRLQAGPSSLRSECLIETTVSRPNGVKPCLGKEAGTTTSATATAVPASPLLVFSVEALRAMVEDSLWSTRLQGFEAISQRLQKPVVQTTVTTNYVEPSGGLTAMAVEAFLDMSSSHIGDTHHKVALEALSIINCCISKYSSKSVPKLGTVLTALFQRLSDRRIAVRDFANSLLNDMRGAFDAPVLLSAVLPRVGEIPERMRAALMQFLSMLVPECDAFFSHPPSVLLFLGKMANVLGSAGSKPSTTLIIAGKRLLEIVYKTSPQIVCGQVAALPMQPQGIIARLMEEKIPDIYSKIATAAVNSSKNQWMSRSLVEKGEVGTMKISSVAAASTNSPAAPVVCEEPSSSSNPSDNPWLGVVRGAASAPIDRLLPYSPLLSFVAASDDGGSLLPPTPPPTASTMASFLPPCEMILPQAQVVLNDDEHNKNNQSPNHQYSPAVGSPTTLALSPTVSLLVDLNREAVGLGLAARNAPEMSSSSEPSRSRLCFSGTGDNYNTDAANATMVVPSLQAMDNAVSLSKEFSDKPEVSIPPEKNRSLSWVLEALRHRPETATSSEIGAANLRSSISSPTQGDFIEAISEIKRLVRSCNVTFWDVNGCQIVRSLLDCITNEVGSDVFPHQSLTGFSPLSDAPNLQSPIIRSAADNQIINNKGIENVSSNLSGSPLLHQQQAPRLTELTATPNNVTTSDNNDSKSTQAKFLKQCLRVEKIHASLKIVLLLIKHQPMCAKSLMESILHALCPIVNVVPVAVTLHVEQVLCDLSRIDAPCFIPLAIRYVVPEPHSDSNTATVTTAQPMLLLVLRAVACAVQHLTPEELLQFVNNALLPAVLPALYSPLVDIRQAAVYALVEMYLVLGDQLGASLDALLSPAHRKLLAIYVNKKRANR